MVATPQASPGYHVTMGQGDANPSEPEWLFRPSGVDVGFGSLGIVLCHWHQSTTVADGMISPVSPKQAANVAAMVRAGYPAISGALAFDAWANDAAMTAITNCITYMSTKFGTAASRAYLYGTSMGALTALRYSALNPSKVAGVAAAIPLTNLNYVYTNNIAGLQTAIATAWGVTAPAALPGPADTINVLPPLLAASKMPVRLYYSTVDTLVRPIDVTNFAAACGSSASATPFDSTFGHVDAALGQLDTQAILNFFGALS